MYVVNTYLKDGKTNSTHLPNFDISTRVFLELIRARVVRRVEVVCKKSANIVAHWDNLYE